jgi:hypothetical protein
MGRTMTPVAGRCLTDAEIAAVMNAPPGAAPEASARHLAACGRCQQRALFGAERRPAAARRAARAPSLKRALLLALLAISAVAFFFWSLGQLTGSAR